MTVISIAGGSREGILSLVKKTKLLGFCEMSFVVFDTNENIGDDQLWTYFHCEDEAEVARKAVKYVADGKAQILMKGIIQTHTLLKELLNKKYNLKTSSILSHVAIVELPNQDKTFLLTDSAMNITPDLQTMIAIVKNVKEVAQKIGISKPKIAMISAAENFNPKMPSSVIGTEVTDYFNKMDDGVVFGPLSLDLALSSVAVEHKNYHGPIMGNADVIVVPQIDVGNCLYKSLVMFANAKIGGTIVGTKMPVVLTSRSDSVESKLKSLEFAIQQLEKGENK